MLAVLLCVLHSSPIFAEEKEEESIYDQRMALFKKTEALTQIPWYYFAAIDNYERNIMDSNEPEKVISIQIPEEIWFGIGNAKAIKDVRIIGIHDGKGKDGDGDGKADPENPEDVLYTMANILLETGPTEDDIK